MDGYNHGLVMNMGYGSLFGWIIGLIILIVIIVVIVKVMNQKNKLK